MLTKQEVMNALLSADSNVSTEIISYVGTNLQEDLNSKTTSDIMFDHNQDDVLSACNVTEQDGRDLMYHLNTYMGNLPSGEKQRSKAVEFILKSNNMRWITLLVIGGLEKASDASEKEDDMKDLIMKALMRKFRDDNEK
jgi:hypothetical protein